MKRSITLTLLALMFSVVSFAAVGPITGTKTLCTGTTTNLSDTTFGGIWSSVNTSVAVIGSTGQVYGISPGTSMISYTVGATWAITTVTVFPTPAAISGPSAVCVGSSITLTDPTSGGTWTSGSTSIATVGFTSGIVTGMGAGVTNIYYVTAGGCGAYKTVTVNPSAPIVGPSTVCVGSTISLTDSVSGGSWLTSSTATATVSSGGVVTGMAFGAVTIYYTVGGCSAFKSMTVMPVPSPIGGPSTVCVGATITLTDASSGGSWSLSPSNASVDPFTGIVTGISAGTAMITYKFGSGCYVTKPITVTTLTTPITGPSIVCIGSTIALTDATPSGTWMSGNTSIATVSSGGLVVGVAAGVVNIYYSVGGCGASKSVTVTAGSVITGPSSVCVGSTIALSDSLSGGTWLTSSTSTATVSSGGIVTGMSAGVVNIYYTVGGCSAFKSVTVMPAPSAISGPSTLCIGAPTTYTDATSGGSWSISPSIATITSGGIVTGTSAGAAIITYTLSSGCRATKPITITTLTTPITGPSTVCIGSTIALTDATPSGTWMSGNTSIATVSSSGIVTGVAAGVVNIYYSVSGCGASKTVTVTGSSKIVGPTSVCVGATISLTDSVSGGTWLTSSTSIATVSSGGVVTGVAFGVVNIYYIVGGCGASHSVTVMPGPGAISGASTVCVSATTTYTDATSGGIWSSSNTSIATVGVSTGVITGVAAGTATITYKLSSGCFVTKTITVTTLTTPITGSSTVCIGSTIALTDATPSGVWLSGNTSIATVSSSGIVTGVAAGVVNIYYSVGGCGASKTVTVTGSSKITGPSTVCVGSTIALTNSTSGGTWLTSSTSTATVSSGGVVTGVAAGLVNIYYVAGGCGAYHTVTVVAAPGAISGASSVCIGATTTYTDATSGGMWSSSNPSIATVGATSGVVTGKTKGTATITYTLSSGCFVTKTITVGGASVITGPSTVCVGATIVLTDSTSGGTWLTSSTSTATVSSGGIVTGMSAGAVTIYYTVGGCSAYKSVTVMPTPTISGGNTICVGSSLTLSSSPSGGAWSTSSSVVATVSSAGVVKGISAGVATFTYTLSTGCSATKSITVNATPSAITGPSTVSVGGTIALTDAVSGGTWLTSSSSTATISSGGVVTGVATGVVNIYYIIGSCAAYKTVTVTPKAPGKISGKIITGGAKGTSGEMPVTGMTVDLKDKTGNLITFTETDGTGTYSFEGLEDGNYVIYPDDLSYTTTTSPSISLNTGNQTVTGINFKKNTATMTIDLYTTEVLPVVINGTISIFPNPTSGTLNIKWDGQATETANMVITDVVGREVFNAPVNMATASGQTQVTLSGLKNGLYLLNIKSENINFSSKLIIQ